MTTSKPLKRSAADGRRSGTCNKRVNVTCSPGETIILASVKSRKLKHFGHTARHNSLAKTSCWVQCREKDAREARRNSGQTTLESGRVSPFRTWSTWRKTEKRIVNSFMSSPTPDNGYGKLHFTSAGLKRSGK